MNFMRVLEPAEKPADRESSANSESSVWISD